MTDPPYRDVLDAWKAEQDARKPLLEIGARYAELAIKSLLLLSGGAAVALAGFAGASLKADTQTAVLQALASSVWWFAWSAAGAVSVAGLSYLSQALIIEIPEPWGNRIGSWFRWAAVLLFIVSLGLFLVGAHAASSALNPTPPTTSSRSNPVPVTHERRGEVTKVYTWMTSSEAANLGQFLGGIGLLVAIVAAIVAYRQMVHTPQSHAKQVWMDYLKLCIEYPDLADGKITEESPEYNRYEWFVAYLLDACDEVLQYVEDDGGWMNAIDSNLGYHKAYLTTARTEAYLCQWSPKVRDRIEKLFA